MKFKEYLNSLVSKRKNLGAANKSNGKVVNTNKSTENSVSTAAECHYDICNYEDVNNLITDDQHSRTQVLLARHAQLVNNIVGTRSVQEHHCLNSCSQCRLSHVHSSTIPPPLPPPPLPPKLLFDHQISFSNRNYSSTLATCSPRRECQQMHPIPTILTQYSTPNPSIISSSSSSLWTTTTTPSKKQRSKIRTNPWIGGTLNSHTHQHQRPSTFIESSCGYHPCTSLQPEYSIYDPAFRRSPPGLIHSESFPQTTSNGNIHLITIPPAPPSSPPLLPSHPPSTLSGTSAPLSNVVLHQSDSGQGFSLSSSRVINSSSSSSSSPSSSSSSSSADSTSAERSSVDDRSYGRQKKLKKKISSTSSPLLMKTSPKRQHAAESYYRPNTIASDNSSLLQRTKGYRMSSPNTLQYHYTHSSTVNKISPIKSPNERSKYHHHSTSSSSRSIDDHFSLEFEEIVENERHYRSRKDHSSVPTASPATSRILSPAPPLSPRKSPFILPLDDTNPRLSSSSLTATTPFSSTLVKTNSRAILRHIEEIENEIRLIKNLDLGHDEDDDEGNADFILSPRAYPEDDLDLDDQEPIDEEQIRNAIRPSIYEQVDQWVEKCLQTTMKTDNPTTTRLHDECGHLSDAIKDYVGCLCTNDEKQTASRPVTTINQANGSPINRLTKRTQSFIERAPKLLSTEIEKCVTLKSNHECPF